MKNKFLLLVTALVLSTTAAFASNQTTLSNLNTIVARESKTGVTQDEVRIYMASFNIIASFVGEESGTANYLVKDVDGNWYRVYVCEAGFAGWDQVDL